MAKCLIILIISALAGIQSTYSQPDNQEAYFKCVSQIGKKYKENIRMVEGFEAEESKQYFRIDTAAPKWVFMSTPQVKIIRLDSGRFQRRIVAEGVLRSNSNERMPSLTAEYVDTISKQQIKTIRKNVRRELRGEHPGRARRIIFPAAGILSGIATAMALFYVRS